MSQRISTSTFSTNRPGAYPSVTVKSTPTGTGASGNIVIIGEARGGAANIGIDSANGDLLKDNFYSPSQLSSVVEKYISGPIVDAFRALTSPSSDANIVGSANNIYIVKTNTGVKSSALVATGYGSFFDKNYGIDGDKYSYQISQSISESAPEVTGTVIGAFGVTLDGLSFSMRKEGGAAVVITLGTGSHADMGELLIELNGLLPADMTAEEGSASDTLLIKIDADASANAKGYSKSFELIDSTPGDLIALGHAEGLSVSSAEPEIQLDINRTDTNINESFLIESSIALLIGYEGTTAEIDVTDALLTATVVGGSGASLSVSLDNFTTMKDLADYINSQTGYTCSVVAEATQLNPTTLDDVSGVDICSSGASLTPGRIKNAAYKFNKKASESSVLDFTQTIKIGLPDVMATKIFLTGGLKGATTSANVVSAIDDLESIDVNMVVPLFSRDASDDITDGLTDSGSTYTVDAVNAATKNHVLKMSVVKIKKNRSAYLSYWGSYSDAKSRSTSLANARVSFAMQKTSQVDSNGNVVNFQPWHTACIAAGMQAAGFYQSITNKFANVISFEDPTGFDSGNPGQVEDAIDAGILFLEKAVVGNRWIVDQTTYGIDTNFVYNSIQAMYSADLVALDLSASFHNAFTGKSLADVSAGVALTFLSSKMESYRKQKLIAASDDAPLAYKNASVVINGSIMEVKVEIKLATAILFIPIDIEISAVQNQA